MDTKEKDTNMCCGHHCGHGEMCGHHFGGKNFLIRWILGIAILAIVFGVGMKIGEFKGSIESGYFGGFPGHHMMMWRGAGGYGDTDTFYSGPGMMRVYTQKKLQSTTTPQ